MRIGIGERARTSASAADVVRGHGLLEPERAERRDPVREADGGRGRQAAVDVDHDLDVGADGLADGIDDRDGLVLLAPVRERAVHGVDLDARKAAAP